MARSRGHSKSQSTSSAVASPATRPSPVALKSATPARKPRRISQPLSPVSPASPGQFPPVRKQTQSAYWTYPVVVLTSFVISTALFSFVGTFTAGDLAAVSRRVDTLWEVGSVWLYRAVELGVYWFAGYDAFDVASLSILLSTPYSLLLALFYNIDSQTVLLNAMATVISKAAPFLILRQISPPHHPHTVHKNLIRNKSILTDPYTTLSTSLLATVIFAVSYQLSLVSFLSVFFITHFETMRSLTFAHSGTDAQIVLLLALIPAGIACTTFLFLPPAGITKSSLQAKPFDPVTASFGSHVYHNAWGWYSLRQQELLGRTAIACVMVAVETTFQCAATIVGVDLIGAAGYAGIFSAALAVVGVVYEWVGGPSG